MDDRLLMINRGLVKRFPDGNDPFQILARLLEECGELAQQVNLFEGKGTKREKYGPPDRAKLALEVKHVLLLGLQVAQFYHVEAELDASIEASYRRMISEGWIETETTSGG